MNVLRTNNFSSVPGKERKKWLKWCLGWLLKGILFLVLLVILIYIEEDFRGEHAWIQTKAKIAAQGISLDPKTYIPPLVPDAVNFGVLPIFRLEPDPKHNEILKPLALDCALAPLEKHFSYSKDQTSEAGLLPYLGKWDRGEKVAIDGARKRLAELCHEAIPPIQVPANASPSEMLDLLCPALPELRAANVTHPACRFEHDYTNPTPLAMSMSLQLTTEQLNVAKVLLYQERMALYDNNPPLALDDLKVDWKIVSGLQKEPILLSGLVCAAVVGIQLEVIREGLDQHVWTDQQLAELDNDLGQIDFLSETPLCLRGDFVVLKIPDMARIKADRFSVIRDTREAAIEFDQKLDWRTYFFLLATYLPSSNGDLDQALANQARFVMLGSAHTIDPIARRVFPEKEGNLSEADSLVQGELGCINRFAYAQVQLDEARIACRLERYRLVHGNYPNSLDTLVPSYAADLQHDIMNGEAYHYKIHGDGTYILYSVGWNQKDDGGQAGPGIYQNPDSPDWIWTSSPNFQKAK